MSERQIEAFREEAERIIEVPALELIEAAGRIRRRRRQAVAGVVAAGALGVAGFLTTGYGEADGPRPAEPALSSLVTPYPGPLMTTLEEGTYELSPGSSGPLVRFTLPPGWNAWEGPNRFEGMGPDITDNEAVLAQGIDWYVHLFVMDVDRVTQRNCTSTDVSGRSTSEFARALARIPDLDVISGPESTVRFGRPAVHLRLRASDAEPTCGWLFRTPLGYHDESELGGTYDVWVIDVDGRPLLVWAGWAPLAPRAEVDALLGIVDTIEVVDRE